MGDAADWSIDTYLLARIGNLAAGLVWQGGGGKGMRPKPIQGPAGKPKRSREERGADYVRRLRNLGLIKGGKAA